MGRMIDRIRKGRPSDMEAEGHCEACGCIGTQSNPLRIYRPEEATVCHSCYKQILWLEHCDRIEQDKERRGHS